MKLDLVIALLLFASLFMSSGSQTAALEHRIKELEKNAAYYLMYNEDLTQAQIDAGGLDPGMVYKASDGNNDIHFVNSNGTSKKTPSANTSGFLVQNIPVQIAEASIVRQTVTTDPNNYTATGFDKCIALFITYNLGGSSDFTGFVAPTGARRVLFANRGTGTIRLMHENILSTTTNRITAPGAANYTLDPGEAVELIYDTVTQRWIVIRD
jgi:hypothetical protein